MFSGLLRKKESPQKCPGTQVTPTKGWDFSSLLGGRLGCPRHCPTQQVEGTPRPGASQYFCLPCTAVAQSPKTKPQAFLPCLSTQKQPISHGHKHGTLRNFCYETKSQRDSQKSIFSKHLAAFKNSFHSCLGQISFCPGRKIKIKHSIWH